MSHSAKKAPAKDGRNTGVRGGRLGRTIVALGAMCLLGALLATLNVFTSRRDLSLATGPRSEAQRQWLVDAADRPDIAQFFKKLPHEDRVTMAKAIGRYDDAPLAKLSGLLLADFDAEARAALTDALKRVAAAHPDAVAEQLKLKGSFQTLGVSEALRTQGARAVPAVVKMLANGDARPSVVAYLVKEGPSSVPSLIPALEDASPDVRHAAADALGQLRATAAVGALSKQLAAAPSEERPFYLAALAAVGDPSSEALMSATLRNPALPLAERTPAALGLGRIGSPEAIRLLWDFAPSDEPALATAALAALGTVGAPALADVQRPLLLRVRVASVVEGPEADAALRLGLRTPGTAVAAVEASRDRPTLLPDLAAMLPAAREDGDLAAALIGVLSTTQEGKERLVAFRDDPALSGFIRRAEG